MIELVINSILQADMIIKGRESLSRLSDRLSFNSWFLSDFFQSFITREGMNKKT